MASDPCESTGSRVEKRNLTSARQQRGHEDGDEEPSESASRGQHRPFIQHQAFTLLSAIIVKRSGVTPSSVTFTSCKNNTNKAVIQDD